MRLKIKILLYTVDSIIKDGIIYDLHIDLILNQVIVRCHVQLLVTCIISEGLFLQD